MLNKKAIKKLKVFNVCIFIFASYTMIRSIDIYDDRPLVGNSPNKLHYEYPLRFHSLYRAPRKMSRFV